MTTNQIILNILAEAVKSGASDIHLSVGDYPAIRLNDQLVTLENDDLITQDFMAGFINSILTEEQKKKLASSREIVTTYNFNRDLRFKINIFYQRDFLSASLRHIPLQIPTLSRLGANPLLAELTKLKKGLIIVAGPFDAGRSTTAAAMIEEINQSRKEYIITIEDLIEHVFVNKKSIIEQREVGRDTQSFADALNYFEEENGDVLFLEEMQDPKIIPLVLEIARGSSLVITTMSADSSAKVVARILDSFTALEQESIRDLLATALKAVICQKLIAKIGGGLIIVQELMLVNDAIKSLIADGNANQLENIIQTSRKEGMVSFDQALAQLVNDRKIDLNQAMDNASDKEKFKTLIK